VLLGDSIGAQWFSAIPEIFRAPVWKTIVLVKGSCPMVDEPWFYPRIGRVYSECKEWRDSVFDELERMRPDVVVVGSAAVYGFGSDSWVEGSARVFQRLSKAAGRVYVLVPTPTLNFNALDCLAKSILLGGALDSNACVATDAWGLVETTANYLSQAAKRFPNVQLIDLNDVVCPNHRCNAVSESGLVIFRDSQHVTDSFVRDQIPLIRDRFGDISSATQ
jgi:SGNH domain (fused to AT3 domains)